MSRWCIKSHEIREFFAALKQEMDVAHLGAEPPGSKTFTLFSDNVSPFGKK